MEPRRVLNEKFFIVLRGKSRKGFCRGCIGRVEAETQRGEYMGLLYSGSSNTGPPKSGGIVPKEDTYPLSRHQAQLLLFVPGASKRLDLLCNPQLFSAICGLSRNDLVVVKHKRGHLPGLVKNLMQIGRKENQEELHMLGFEVEFVDHDHNLSSKKPAPLPIFNAGDVVQVVPSHNVPFGPHWNDGKGTTTNRKAVTRINSMPNIRSHTRQGRESQPEQTIIPSPTPSEPAVSLEVGSLVEVVSNTRITVYGVIRWLGNPPGKSNLWAGIELDYEVYGCSDGLYGGQRYFTCKASRALFVPLTKCSPDSRFVTTRPEEETLEPTGAPPG